MYGANKAVRSGVKSLKGLLGYCGVLLIKMIHCTALPLYIASYSPQFSPPESSSYYSVQSTLHTWLNCSYVGGCLYEHKLLQIAVHGIIALCVQLADKHAISNGELLGQIPVLVQAK